MKKILRKIILILIFLLSFFYIITNKSMLIKAYDIETNPDLKNIIVELFGKKEIKNSDYLYNFDDEAIFIYAEFTDGGYCIISKDGETILEYSLNGSGPYHNDEKKYYCGPTYYFSKINENQYYNNYNNEIYNLTGEILETINEKLGLIVESSTINYNNMINVYNSSFNDNESRGNIPSLDEEGIIYANTPSASGTKYIQNYQYFTSNPMHGYNSTGTCGAVAAQLMLSYHNYYSDRRIIPSNFLNGGWNNSSGDNDIFNPSNYDNPSLNPNVCSNPEMMNWYTLGSTGNNETDLGTYFNYLVNKIQASATTSQVKNGMIKALEERNEILSVDISFDIDSHFGMLFGSVSEQGIKDEIDADRPVIILMQQYLGGWDHYVVAYGYQNIISPTNNKEYSGFITHFGYGYQSFPNKLNVWINSSWCYSYISMNINHTHNYSILTNNIIDNSKIELRCDVCGHRILDDIYEVSANKIEKIKYVISKDIIIPAVINGNEIFSIGSNAFSNLENISSIVIPNTVTNIDSSAFENCSNLQNVTLPNSLISIGNSVFEGCTSLSTITIPNSVQHIGSSAFENCSNLQNITLPNNLTSIGYSLFKRCFVLSTITIPNSVQHIGSSAFEGCTNLKNVTLSNNLTRISNSIFKGCTSLSTIVIPDSIQHIDSSAFENCSSLQNITLPNSLNNIDDSVFKGCTSLSTIVIPDSVQHIDSRAFEYCIDLSSITLSNNLNTIGSSAFEGCTRLTNITLPSRVQNIDYAAFRNCSSLSLVTVQKEAAPITNLGEYAFLGCSQSLQIVVPMNRVAEYKNKQYWSSYKTKIVPTSDNYKEVDLNCLSDFYNLTTLSASCNKLYKLNVECAKTYKIFSNSNVSFKVYNYAMDNVASGQDAITTYLGIGTYYLSIEFTSNSSSGMIVTNYALAWGNQGESMNYNTDNDVTTHLHQVGTDHYKSKLKYNNSVSGFYQIVLTGFDLNGNEVAYPSGMITIYSDSSRTTILDRYDVSNNNYAINETGENVMYIYLPEAYCYIDIDTDRNDFESLTLNILPISEISLDYLSSIETITQNNIIEDVTDFAYFKQVTISHRSKFILEVLPDENVSSELPIYIFKKLRDPGYEAGDDHFYIEPTLVSNISFNNAGNELTIILDAGTYYFGYSNNNGMSLSFTLTRFVNTSEEMDNTLITDPGAGFVPGSEVRFNNGLYGGLTITEGFTRNLFFSQEYVDNTKESRLEYDWYSSNPNVASVSEFGTVLALNVIEDTEVKIYAVNKADPSKVYYIELTILKETKAEKIVIECNMSYSYSEENGMYTLELDFSNSPYPYIGYYVWSIECLDEISIDMDHHNLITSTGTGEAILTANYTLNMRVFLVIHLTITE